MANRPLPADSLSLKVLLNLPYARRGYVFKNRDLQQYFQGQSWYLTDSSYVPRAADLTKKETEWLEKIALPHSGSAP